MTQHNGTLTNGPIPNGKPAPGNLTQNTPNANKKGVVAFIDPPPKDEISKEKAAISKSKSEASKQIPVSSNEAEPKLQVADPMIIFGFIRFRPEWVVKTESTSYYCWLTLVSLVFLYNTIVVAMRAVFDEMNEDYLITYWIAIDYTGDAIYFLDLFISMFSGYLSEDLLNVEEPRKLFKHWITSSTGKMDVLSILPTDLAFIWTGMGKPYPAVRFNRLFKYSKFTQYLESTEGRVPNPQVLRLTSVLLKFFLLIHLNACLYYCISEYVGLNSDGWVYPGEAAWRKSGENETNADDSLSAKFTWSFYWSFHTLTMIGITKQPETEWQFLFLTVQFVAGVMLFSQILGNTILTVLKANAQARKFRGKIDLVVQYLEMRNISKEIRQKVMDYFEYQWIQRRLIDDKEALASLPEKIEADVAIKVHLATLKHVRIFQGVEPGLLVDLVLKLELQVFAPGEYVCRKGDIGRELYIVKKGCLEVVSDDGSFVYARLGEGSVFGEISILNIKGIKTGNRRTANVRSIGYADLFRLSKDHLWEALQEYPEGKNKILELGRQILLKDNLISLQEEEEDHRRHQLFLDQMSKVEDGVSDIQLKLGRLVAERACAIHKMKQRIARLEALIALEDKRDAEISAQTLLALKPSQNSSVIVP